VKHLLAVLALSTALAGPALAGQTRTAELLIPGMTACPSCPYIVQRVLGELPGVDRVETVYETGIATVTYDDSEASLADFRAALAEYGYSVEDTPEPAKQ
jgi:mercuric ion binding protein